MRRVPATTPTTGRRVPVQALHNAWRWTRHCSCPGFVDTGLFGFEESTMGKTRAAYPPEFRRQMVDLVRAGRSPEELAREFVNAIGGHRFDGRPETQPRPGTIRAGARNGKKQANQASIRSTAAGFAPALNRRSQEKSTALGRLGCQQG